MFDKNIKYRDIFIVALVGFIGYKFIDNYEYIFTVLKSFYSIVTPFIYALVFAYVLNPVMKLFEKRFKLKRGLSILLTYVSILGIIALIAVFVVPNIMDSIVSMISEVPWYMTTVQDWINKLMENKDIYSVLKETGLVDYLSAITSKTGSMVVGMLESSISSIFVIATNMVKIILGFLIAIYVLLDKEIFKEHAKLIICMIFKRERGEKIVGWIKLYNKMIGMYVGTKALDSLIIGLLALVGLIIMRAPYSILIALVVGFTNMIPYFGPLVGEIVGGVVGIFVSPTMALMIVIYLLILQQFDAWYLEAKLVGKKVGVRPFLIILAVFVGGGLFGPVGMILGSPTMATIKIMYDKKVEAYKEENKVEASVNNKNADS